MKRQSVNEPLSPEELRLRSFDVTERRRSIRELGRSEDGPRFFRFLQECLESDPVWSVREAAAEALGLIARKCIDNGDSTGRLQREVLLKSCLQDSNEFVREMCRQQLGSLNIGWPDTFAVLDNAWQTERIHIRRRVLQVYSDFAQKRSALQAFAEALSDGHWKMRCTALIELKKHWSLAETLFSDVIRRCFDMHSSVAVRARQAIKYFRPHLPDLIFAAVQGNESTPDPQTALADLCPHASATDLETLNNVCHRRLSWHIQQPGDCVVNDDVSAKADYETLWTFRTDGKHASQSENRSSQPQVSVKRCHELFDACVAAARKSRQPDRNAHREAAWLTGQLCALLLNAQNTQQS